MKKLLMFAAFAAAVLCGCGRVNTPPAHIIILVDVSGSIEPDSLSEAFKAIDDLLRYVNRGDKVSVIPITSDAQVETSGRVLRFRKPTKREAYEADVLRFSRDVRKSLDELRTKSLASPGGKTDILGAIKMAEEELMADPKLMNSRLIILSDFIEEDSEFNFKVDARLANNIAAAEFASALTKGKQRISFTYIYLGLLRSKDIRSMDKRRRVAIHEFWKSYVASLGPVEFATDGTGRLILQLQVSK